MINPYFHKPFQYVSHLGMCVLVKTSRQFLASSRSQLQSGRDEEITAKSGLRKKQQNQNQNKLAETSIKTLAGPNFARHFLRAVSKKCPWVSLPHLRTKI